MENQEFKSAVEEEKQEHIGNISIDMMKYYDKWTIKPEDFFSWKEINPQSFREFFLVNKYPEDYINGKLPKVSFEKRKEEILAHIEAQEVTNPTELVLVIAEYMKNLIKYDIIEAIPQIKLMGENIAREWEINGNKAEAIESALAMIKEFMPISDEKVEELRELYKWMKAGDITKHLYQTIYLKLDQKKSIVMGEKEYQLFKDKVNHLLDTENLSEKEKISIFINMGNLPDGFVEKLQNWLFADNHSYTDFKKDFRDIIAKEKPKDRDEFIANFHKFFTSFILDDIIHSNGEYELADKLYKNKVWVCRDYSIMMKKIYQELSPKLFPNSEVLYVLNHQRHHAYNCLVFENKKWEVEYKYFDLTRYINWWDLFIKEEEKKKIWLDSKYDVLVKNELNDLKDEIEGDIIS